MSVRIRKRNGAWWVFICFHGRRKARKIGTREAAERVKREIEARLALGDVGIFEKPAKSAPTFREYSEQWMHQHVAASCKRSTADNYTTVLNVRVLPRFGSVAIDKISRADIREYLAEMVAEGRLRRRTITLTLGVIRAVLSAAVDDGLIQANPAVRLGKFTQTGEQKFKATPLAPDEAVSLITAAKEYSPEFFHPLVLVALRAGLRRGEIIGLKFGDIQFGESERDRNRYILVQRNVSARYGKFTTPKNKKDRRVDLSKELRAVLLEVRDRRLLEAFANGKASVAEELVFPSSTNTPLTPGRLIEDFFQPCLELAGLHHRRFHDLRHTFASNLLRAGAPMTYVKDQLGHGSIAVTVDLYGHLLPGADVDWMEVAATTPQPSATQLQLNKTPETGEVQQAVSPEVVVSVATVQGLETTNCNRLAI